MTSTPTRASLCLLLLSLLFVTPALAETRVKRLAIGAVPSGFPVRFCLLTHGEKQYVAYYNADHEMTVASRSLDSDKWTYVTLPSKVGWDSHNYITMAVDSEGYLHLSGNMHCVNLIYFRSTKPGDITTFKKHAMTGQAEKRVTYPKFLTDHQGTLIFTYRDGGSGRGVRFYNKYNPKTQTWARLLDTPLLDGKGKCNAYPAGPTRGPDGLFHLVWVWRDTPDCATNHDLSYARSRDLIHWETAGGKKMKLPMTLADPSPIVVASPSRGGMINGGQKLTFDSARRPIIVYHKNDDAGHMQIYASRFEQGKWVQRQLTQWDKPVPFSGRGAMGFIGIRISGLTPASPNAFTMTYRHKDLGKGKIVIDEKTLLPTKRKVTGPKRESLPASLNKSRIHWTPDNAKLAKAVSIRRANDLGQSNQKNVRYFLQWETQGANHDRKPKHIPPDSTLELIELRTNDQ